jgi:hypothetical protein
MNTIKTMSLLPVQLLLDKSKNEYNQNYVSAAGAA